MNKNDFTHRRRRRLRHRFTLSSTGSFGRDSPKFTIASSRRDSPPLFPLPGPGEYDPRDPDAGRPKHAICGSRPVSVVGSDTSNIGLFDIRVFPESRAAHIFGRCPRGFFDVAESPGPSYLPANGPPSRGHKIAERRGEKNSGGTGVGPGEYDVRFPALPRDPAYNFYGPKRRDDWMLVNTANPGPGQYSPCSVLARQPQWTIGRKSRPNRRAKSVASKRKKDLVAVDVCIISLDELVNPQAARQYIMTHLELRDVVHEILERVLNLKPDDPIAFILQYFKNIKERMEAEELKKDKPKVDEIQMILNSIDQENV